MRTRYALKTLCLGGALSVLCIVDAGAAGAVRIVQSNGIVHEFPGATVTLQHNSLNVTANDGQQLIVSHGNCAYDGDIERCSPYSVRIQINGTLQPVTLASGVAYINPTKEEQTVPQSSTTLEPYGIDLSLRTTDGTTVSLTGEVDKLIR